MTIHELDHKQVCVIGYGKEGKSVVKALQLHAPHARITVADQEPVIPKDFLVRTGENYLSNLVVFDVIIKSPGVPPQPQFEGLEDRITNSTQIFAETARELGATLIGVTGSKGKSTTSSLIYEVLKAGKLPVKLAGNIGVPPFDLLEHLKPGDIVVLEMSSYQLAEMKLSPDIAVFTSFFPDHLDWHGSLAAYFEAKANIVKFQTSQDEFFYNAEFDELAQLATQTEGTATPFTTADSPVTLDEIKLIGEHNLSNCAAAFMVGRYFGVAPEDAKQALREFGGLPHRLENLGETAGICWVDDAISTTPESTIAGLKAFVNQVGSIILGGLDRGYDFTELASYIASRHISVALLFPGSGPRIREALEAASFAGTLIDVADMKSAVEAAAKHTEKSTTCLLSTASPSYNMFKNFEDKGNQFKAAISELK